jgi:hypothetical protein
MPTNKILTELWKSPQTFGIVLLTVFLDRFGMEGLQWDPATITLEVEEEFDVDLPQSVLDKLMVAINIFTADAFYNSLPDFIVFCNVLSGDTYRPDMFDPADSLEVAWGLTEGLLIAPPEDDGQEDGPFSDEIRAYIGALLDQEGIINAPDVLQIALRQANVSDAANQFSDDPEMFNAIYDVEAGKTAEINQVIFEKAKMLIAQLQAIKLDNGSTEGVARMLESSLRK